MDTMKAVRIHSYGGPDALIYENAPRPHPGKDEVLLRVHAAGVNPVDWKVREGQLREMLNHQLPLILGWDVSGTIEAVGSEVAAFKIGDSVFSHPNLSRDGAYAEYLVIKASEVAFKPDALDHIHAAAVPLAALISWQSLFDAARLAAGQKVLIHGAAGGVGHYAVQLANWKGAHVIGTASPRNVDFVQQLGACEVVDYTTTRFEDVVGDVDVVFDTRGGDTREKSWGVLKKGGMLVSVLPPPPSEETASSYGVQSTFMLVQPNAVQLGEISELIDSGHIKPAVEKVVPLAETRKAHDLSQQGHTRGKIILNVTG